MSKHINSYLEDGIFFFLYLASISYYFFSFNASIAINFAREFIQLTGLSTRKLSEFELQLLISYICIFLIFACIFFAIKLIMNFCIFRKDLSDIFLGEFSQFKEDFLKILLKQTLYVGLIFLLFFSYIRTVKRMPQPFGHDFFYLAFLVYISVAAFTYVFHFLPLFFYAIKRKN